MASYGLNQCALFKVRSKGRLADLLHIRLSSLQKLAKDGQYKVFTLAESVCEFTGKTTKARSVEEPKGELRRVHDRLRELLSRVTLVDYAHAAVKGRSYRSNAKAHCNADVVATFDVEKFYPSTTQAHVTQFFYRCMQCSADVANLLGQLLCFRSTKDAEGCLPTGSPASPIVSIYANMPMFDALDRLATTVDLKFTCYVDDLTFSGEQLPPNLHRRVNSIVASHGHKLNPKKTKVFGKGKPKHVTGVVIKDGRITVPHSRFLKARRISHHLASTTDPGEQMRLLRKLSGLLGEAAYLDNSYAKLAEASYRDLAAASVEPIRTVAGTVVRIVDPLTEKQELNAPAADDAHPPWA